MRVFYIFQIKKDLEKITKENPYMLFNTLETIYYREPDDIRSCYTFLHQIIDKINIKEIDIALFKKYKENFFYMKYRNVHSLHDVYRQENTTITLNKTYIKLETNVIKPRFLEELHKQKNYFVCDFKEKDYFWLSSLTPIG